MSAAIWCHATEMAEWPVIAAAHVLAPEIFFAVRAAFHDEPKANTQAWIALSYDEKAHYIDTAVAVLELRRRGPMQIATGLRPTHGVVIGAFGPKGAA